MSKGKKNEPNTKGSTVHNESADRDGIPGLARPGRVRRDNGPTVRFRPMRNGLGLIAQLPDGSSIVRWDQKHFAVPVPRFQAVDREWNVIAEGSTILDVLAD